MLPDMAGVPVDTALVFILKTAYHLFEQFRNRDRNRQAFATCEPMAYDAGFAVPVLMS